MVVIALSEKGLGRNKLHISQINESYKESISSTHQEGEKIDST